MAIKSEEIAERIALSAQLAALLEVSGWPKPGNVHRTADFPDTRYEHFLAGSVGLGPAVRDAALMGIKVGQGKISASEARIGSLIKRAAISIKESHLGGNTHLGTILLFIPLACAAGKTYAEFGTIDSKSLRKNVGIIMSQTTPQDAVEAYEAIAILSSPEELGEVKGEFAPDVFDKDAKKKLLERCLSLYDCMKASSEYDGIAREWASEMEASFEVGYPTLTEVFEETKDINVASVHTFLSILSKFGDTFMARKVGLKEAEYVEDAIEIGMEKTRWIRDKARSILELGGLKTKEGSKELWKLDRSLQRTKGMLSPGTTADITANSLFIALLCGLKF